MAKRTEQAAIVAEMIADWFGRSVIDTDYELAYQIMDELNPDSHSYESSGEVNAAWPSVR